MCRSLKRTRKHTPSETSFRRVIRILQEKKVKFIDLHFSDVIGRLQHTTISTEHFDLESFTEGLPKLDGSSIKGFVEIQESDLVIKPDPNTLAIIPWISDDIKTARMFCDIYWGYGGERLSRDPRWISQKAEQLLTENKNKLELLAKNLLEKETLQADEVYKLLEIEPRESHDWKTQE